MTLVNNFIKRIHHDKQDLDIHLCYFIEYINPTWGDIVPDGKNLYTLRVEAELCGVTGVSNIGRAVLNPDDILESIDDMDAVFGVTSTAIAHLLSKFREGVFQ